MENLKGAGTIIFGFAIIGGVVYGVWWALGRVWPYLSTMDPGVLAAIVTAASVAIGTIFVKHIEHKHSVEAQFRDTKVELYDGFMQIFNKIMEGSNDDRMQDSVSELKEWKRKLLFYGGPEVVKVAHSLGNLGDNKTVRDLTGSLQIMGQLMLAMRKDLGLSNRGIVGTIPGGLDRATVLSARQILRNPDLVFAAIRKNPSMLLKELDSLEKPINSARELR